MLTALIESHKAGSPTDSSVYWISLKPCAIAKLFAEQHQIKVSNGLIKRLLKELGYFIVSNPNSWPQETTINAMNSLKLFVL